MLDQLRLFAGLRPDDLSLLERLMVVEEHARPVTLLRQGDQADGGSSAVYLLLEGQVEVTCSSPSGEQTVRKVVTPGALLGLVALFDDGPRSATCTTLGPSRTARLDRRTLKLLLRTHRGVHARFQLLLAQQLASDIRRLDERFRTALKTGQALAEASMG